MAARLSLTHQSFDRGKDWVDPLVCQKVDGGLTPLSLVEVHMLTIPDSNWTFHKAVQLPI